MSLRSLVSMIPVAAVLLGLPPLALGQSKDIKVPPNACKMACEAMKKSCPKSCKQAETKEEQQECEESCPDAIKHCEESCPQVEAKARAHKLGKIPSDVKVPPSRQPSDDAQGDEPGPGEPAEHGD